MVLTQPTPTDTRSDQEQRDLLLQLDDAIARVVLSRQHPITGLLPASTAHTVHGNYGDAWVRDCVYSTRPGARPCPPPQTANPALELEQRVLALMRIAQRNMRQAHKVERFKTAHPLDALHAKYDTANGDGCARQRLGASAGCDLIALLQLAQLTRGG